MSYGHAVLGESVELYKEAVEWGKDQKKRTEKNAKARMMITESLAPMLEEKRKCYAGNQSAEANSMHQK
jgi:hypothetical protein